MGITFRGTLGQRDQSDSLLSKRIADVEKKHIRPLPQNLAAIITILFLNLNINVSLCIIKKNNNNCPHVQHVKGYESSRCTS